MTAARHSAGLFVCNFHAPSFDAPLFIRLVLTAVRHAMS
jgi:hypothetical protein